MLISASLLEMNKSAGVEMKNETIVVFVSEMNIDLEMKHHNEMEMKHHAEMKDTSQWK